LIIQYVAKLWQLRLDINTLRAMLRGVLFFMAALFHPNPGIPGQLPGQN
jgi:hypothetical protein